MQSARYQNHQRKTKRNSIYAPRLHAKIYATKDFCIVGSSNVSTNGLALEGSESAGWVEANILSDDKTLVRRTTELFEGLWASQEATEVAREMLTKAIVAWDNRPKPIKKISAKTLLAACHESPKSFGNVFVFAYDSGLGENGHKALDSFRDNAYKPAGGTRSAVSDFRKAVGYQYDHGIDPGSWLIDINCINERNPRFVCCAKVTDPLLCLKADGETDVTVAIRQPVRLSPSGPRFLVSAKEESDLERNATKFLKDILVPISEVIKIVDRAG